MQKVVNIMDKNTFGRIVNDPTSYTKELKQEILAARLEYPYCSLLQMFDLLSDKACANLGWEVGRRRTQLFLPESCKLNQLIDKATLKAEASADIFQEINAYQDISFKTAPKSVILSKFLENEVCEGLNSDDGETLPFEEIAKKSITSNDNIGTETLAVIYQKQGKYEKALEIYQKLISKYPEKSSIFASRISEINILIETNKK